MRKCIGSSVLLISLLLGMASGPATKGLIFADGTTQKTAALADSAGNFGVPVAAVVATIVANINVPGRGYIDLPGSPGPVVTATVTGTTALVTITAGIGAEGPGAVCMMGFAVGATAASDNQSLMVHGTPWTGVQASATYLVTGLTTGSNTFTAKYRGGGNLGCGFGNRSIIVTPY